MYKLQFTLKQHTPLIHFQHDQAGATLRATEVKPKLDRFIIEKLTKLKGDDAIKAFKADPKWRKWLIGNGEHPALDYKMRIVQPKNVEFFLPLALSLNSRRNPNKENNLKNFVLSKTGNELNLIAPSPYFANSDKIKFIPRSEQIDELKTNIAELKFAVFSNDEIALSIITYDEELNEEIKNSISLFFLVNNFGTRQSKGFGSYTLTSDSSFSKEHVSTLISTNQVESIYQKTISDLSVSRIFDDIVSTWKILKAGNSFGTYQKSDLFNYFYHRSKPIRWEKRTIKKNLKSNYPDVFSALRYDNSRTSNTILTETDTATNHYYIRALLGLAEHFEYGTSDGRNKVKIKVMDRLSNSQRTKEVSIDRFRAPITFKVIGKEIYLITYKIDPLLIQDKFGNNRKFDFHLDAKINRKNHSGLIDTLEIPDSFSVSNFLDSEKYDTNTWKPKLINGKTISVAESFKFKKL